MSVTGTLPAEGVELVYARRPSALPYMLRAVRPVRRRLDLEPPICARWRSHHVNERDLAAYRQIAPSPQPSPADTGEGRRAGETLPLLYPHTFGFRLAMAILTHPRFPVPIWGVLQTRNHIVQHVPIATDASLDFETRVLPGRVVPKGAEFDLRTTVHVAGALAWESIVTFFTRGRFGEPDAPSPYTRSPTEFGDEIAAWTMADTDHVRFGRFTGDYNGIHLWDWYARRMGFRRALYHPSRVLGQCLAKLPSPGLRPTSPATAGEVKLDAWIKGPVPHGARVRLHAATAAAVTTFALFADDEARPAFVGRLTATEARP
jgi:acyl dehydratase